MLFCLYNMTKKHEFLPLSSKGSLKVQLNHNQKHVCCVSRHMAKLCTYILYKSISLKNFIKEKHNSGRVYKVSQWSSTRYLKSHISNILVNIFWFKWKNIFLVERIYQLKSFDTTFIGCHLSCLLLASYRQMKYLGTNLISTLNVVSLPVGMQHDIAYEISESTG